MKILVPGLGSAQADLIKYLKDKGHTVLGISYRNEGPGLLYLDNFKNINIKDKKSVLEFALENQIDLIYSAGSDFAMPAIAYVSEQMNLPHFFDQNLAFLVINKLKLRQFLNFIGISQFSYLMAGEITDLNSWNKYPAVIKPADSQGQRGVFKVNNYEELKLYFYRSLNYSDIKQIILEEYIDGQEFSLNTYCVDGNLVYYFFSERLSFDDYTLGIVKGHIMPAIGIENLFGMIKSSIVKVLKISGLLNGPAYFQFKIHNDELKIIEFTTRLDGCHLWRLIKEVYNIDLLEITINHLLFNKFDYKPPEFNGNYCLEFFHGKPFTKFIKPDTFNYKNEVYREYYYNENELIRPINGIFEKTGYIINKL